MKTREQWRKSFLRGSPESYRQARIYDKAESTQYVVFKNKETTEGGYVICVADTDFWMDLFPTKKECLAFCKQMGWGVQK